MFITNYIKSAISIRLSSTSNLFRRHVEDPAEVGERLADGELVVDGELLRHETDAPSGNS